MRNSLKYLLLVLLALTMWTGTTKAQEGLGIQVVKLSSPQAVPGGLLTYSLFVGNNGTSFFFNSCAAVAGCSVVLTDDIPAGFQFNEGDITATKFSATLPPETILCGVVAGDLVCDIGDFFPTTFVEINIPGFVDPGVVVGSTLTNDVLVEPIGPSFLVADSDSFDTEIVGSTPSVDLAIFKTDAPDPVIGLATNVVTYTLAVTNSGPLDATNILVTDILPPTVSFDSVSPAGPCSHDGSPTGGVVTCNFPSLAVGDVGMIEITVNPPALNIGDPEVSIINIAQVASDEIDGAPANNVVGESTLVVAPGPAISESDLVVTKTSPEIVIQGQPFSYTVNIFNAGPDEADNVRFRDAPFMNTLINIPGIISTDPVNCIVLPMAPNFRCDLVNPLPAGQSVTLIIPAMYDINAPLPIDPLPIFNVANAILGPSNTANTVQDDPVPSNNTFVNVTNVVAPPPNTTESDLIVTKTSPDTVIAGDVFVYTSQIFNAGPDTADNVVFRDALPTDVAFLGAATTGGGACGATPNGFSCTGLDPIPPGQSITVNARARYDGPVLFEPFPIFNVANAELGPSNLPNTVQLDPIPENNTDVRVTNIINPPPTVTISDLVITKAGADVVVPGEEIAYNIEVTNLGPDTAQNVIVRDIIPEFVNFNSFPGDCSIVVGELICNIGDLANGEVRRIGIRADYIGPVPPLPLFRPIFNLAHVDFGPTDVPDIQIDPETADNTVVALTRAIEPPPNINLIDLFLVKTDAPDPVVVEEDLTYNLNVYNFGPNDAVGVVVTDTLPPTVTNIDAPAFCAINSNVVTCLLPNPIQANGGVAIIPITVTAPEDPGMILNAAQTFADPFALLESDNTIQIDFAPSNNTDSEKTTVVPVPPPLSDLLITKSDTPDPVIEDDFLTYTIFVKNLGPDPAYGVLVSDWLSQLGLDLTTVTFQNTPNVLDCVQNPDFPIFDEPYRVECVIPFLGVEESATITVRVKTLPLPNGFEFLNIFNLAKVQSLGDEINPASADPNPLNNVVVESTLIGPFVPVADLFIIKSDSPDPVLVGSTLTYVLFVSNAGPDPATNVVVTDTLPDTVNFISATPDQGNCSGPVGGKITCNLGDLAVGAFTEVRILVTPTVSGTILNVAQVEGDEHDPKSSNNISPQTTTVLVRPLEPPDPGEPNGNDLFVLKFVSPNPATVGDEILFTIILGNNGQFGSGVTVIDDLPNGLTFLSATSNTGEECAFDGDQVKCEIGTVPPLGQGETVIIEVLVRADQTGSIPNIAFLDDIPDDPNTANNVSIVAVDVVPDNGTPQPTPAPNPTPTPGGENPGSNDSSGSSGCTVASGAINPGNTAINFAMLLLPLLVFGIRSLRRKK